MRRLCLLRQGHMEQVSEIETGLKGTGVQAAQLIAAADLSRMPIKTALGLLKVPRLLVELSQLDAQAPLDAAGLKTRESIMRQFDAEVLKCRDHTQQRALQTRLASESTPLARLSHRDLMRRLGDAHAWLPMALDALSLDWAQELMQTMESAAGEICGRGDGVGEDVTRQVVSQMMLREARADFEAERAKRNGGQDVAGSSKVVGQDWLESATARPEPNAAEQASMVSLLQHYQVPETYWSEWKRLLWMDMHTLAKAELALFRAEGQAPTDVASQRYSRQDLVNRLSSTQGYVSYLMGDAVAYQRVADVSLNARLSVDRLASEAHNGGLLRRPQLMALQRERDPQRKAQMAELAFRTFRISGRRDWAGMTGDAERPVYRDFAAYLGTEGGRRTFSGVWTPDDFDREHQAFVYQANVLDFISLTQQRLGLTDVGSAATPRALKQARDAVDAQLALIAERRFPETRAAEQRMSEQARTLLTQLKTKINNALIPRR
jgi:hypothetical protein